MIRQHAGRGAAGLGAYYGSRPNLPINGLGLSPDGLGAGCIPCGQYSEEMRTADEAWMRQNRAKLWAIVALTGGLAYGLYRLASMP